MHRLGDDELPWAPGIAEPRARSGTTRHARIVGDIRARIVEGRWPSGFKLPVETELAESYGVSRMTMNKALAQLAREGFLIRRKKIGTQVAQPRAQSVVMAIADIGDEVRASGRQHRFALREHVSRPASGEDVGLLGEVVEGAPIVRLEGLHLADGAPFCLERRLINPAVAAEAASQDFTDLAPGAWLFKTVPWSVASHRVRAVNATVGEARILDVAVSEACLEIVRCTHVSNDWVTWVRLLYPGSGHQLVARFGPQSDETASDERA
ncbi:MULTISPECIES: UTRA domain-containing protein [unclassified Aureimonas]|uniref:UTRA domain-containing protein n=1 Tax=unclassified Aureimonas TaxID=2615206 RepID=UPI0006F40D08|nr:MULTISPECIES: UTRA domain-containing protein [unclassified Aureimonas]KQT68965.1 hypothetical protein ASG54_04720 [Aureimonas sp. Leaf460]KQT69194.1 hypothetical protein ASG62_17325 [Aureimonas sp. Leaf427]